MQKKWQIVPASTKRCHTMCAYGSDFAEPLKRAYERNDREDRHPPHHDVRQGRHDPEPPSRPDLEENPRKRPAPLDAEDGPREPRMVGPKRHEAERRVSSRYQEVDRHMVHLVQDSLRRKIGNRMVCRRYRVEEDHRKAKDCPRSRFPRDIHAARGALPDEKREHRRAKVGAHYVRDRVCDFLAGCIWPFLSHFATQNLPKIRPRSQSDLV